jgi:hypothetical protein
VALATPALGLVVRYGFVWAGHGRRPPPDAGKDRPCLIVDLREAAEPPPSGRTVQRVTYLPISHTPPRAGETALIVPDRVARHLGLTGQTSWLYCSYAVEDDWPFDLVHVPGSGDRFDHGFIPPRLFARIAAVFAESLLKHPGLVHRPPT